MKTNLISKVFYATNITEANCDLNKWPMTGCGILFNNIGQLDIKNKCYSFWMSKIIINSFYLIYLCNF